MNENLDNKISVEISKNNEKEREQNRKDFARKIVETSWFTFLGLVGATLTAAIIKVLLSMISKGS